MSNESPQPNNPPKEFDMLVGEWEPGDVPNAVSVIGYDADARPLGSTHERGRQFTTYLH